MADNYFLQQDPHSSAKEEALCKKAHEDALQIVEARDVGGLIAAHALEAS